MFRGPPPAIARKPERTVFVCSLEEPSFRLSENFPREAANVVQKLVSLQPRTSLGRSATGGRVFIPLTREEKEFLDGLGDVEEGIRTDNVRQHALAFAGRVFAKHELDRRSFTEASLAYFTRLLWHRELVASLKSRGFDVLPMHSSQDREYQFMREAAFEYTPRFSNATALAEANALAISEMASTAASKNAHFCIVPSKDLGKFAAELRARGLKVKAMRLKPLFKSRHRLPRLSRLRRKATYFLASAAHDFLGGFIQSLKR